jgi:Tfp pilus assembly protein PilV
MRIFSLDHDQRGDTIVEVLIAVGIITLVLAGAYKITTRNMVSIQDVQEHSYALKLAETQTEKLRAAASSDIDAMGASFCFYGNALKAYDETNNDCKQQKGGATYLLKISKPVGPSTTYTITVRWQSITGSDALVTNYYARYD